MARTGTAETLASHVYEQIRADILGGAFEPGQRLKPAELRVRFGVSVSVVREALSRLAEHRLVRGEHNQGFHVTQLSEKDLRDLTDLRVEIEGYALRLSVQRGDLRWESQVVAAHHLLTVTPMRTAADPHRTSEEWSSAHRQFHQALIVGCDVPMLLDICASLFDASELYRRLSAPVDGGRDSASEHRQLMEAALARDSTQAASSLESHFRKTTELLLCGVFAAPSEQPIAPRRRRVGQNR